MKITCQFIWPLRTKTAPIWESRRRFLFGDSSWGYDMSCGWIQGLGWDEKLSEKESVKQTDVLVNRPVTSSTVLTSSCFHLNNIEVQHFSYYQIWNYLQFITSICWKCVSRFWMPDKVHLYAIFFPFWFENCFWFYQLWYKLN